MLDFVAASVDAAAATDSVALLSEERKAYVRLKSDGTDQSRDFFRRELKLSVGDGKKWATVSTSGIDKELLSGLVSRIRDTLKASEPDRRYMPAVPDGLVYPVVSEAWDEYTYGCSTEDRKEAAKKLIEMFRTAGFESDVLLETKSRLTALATSTGNMAFHRSTSAAFSCSITRDEIKGYTASASVSLQKLELNGATATAETLAGAAGRLVSLPELSEYSLVLDSEATRHLLMFLPWVMDAGRAEQSENIFRDATGKQIFGSNFTLSSNLHGEWPGVPFDSEGFPAEDVVWFERGVLKNIPCDRYTASLTGRPHLFFPETMSMDGGEEKPEELIACVKKGIFIQKLSGMKLVNPKSLVFAGKIRDGAFLIDEGRIAAPIGEFHLSFSLPELFSKMVKAGKPRCLAFGMVPPILTGRQRI